MSISRFRGEMLEIFQKGRESKLLYGKVYSMGNKTEKRPVHNCAQTYTIRRLALLFESDSMD